MLPPPPTTTTAVPVPLRVLNLLPGASANYIFVKIAFSTVDTLFHFSKAAPLSTLAAAAAAAEKRGKIGMRLGRTSGDSSRARTGTGAAGS